MQFQHVPQAKLPTRFGEFVIYGYQDPESGEESVVVASGPLSPASIPLVRIHSQCLTGDVFASERCDCAEQLHTALRRIADEPPGLLVYQQREGRGIGLTNKIRAYELQDLGLDTVSANEKLGFKADQRDYRFPAAILRHLGAIRIRLLSNNPEKVAGLVEEGIEVVERLSLEIPPNTRTRSYLQTKKTKLGHLLGTDDDKL